MVDWDSQRRVLVTCVHCGSVRVAVELRNGEIKPIGNATECNECGKSDFEPLDDVLDIDSDDGTHSD